MQLSEFNRLSPTERLLAEVLEDMHEHNTFEIHREIDIGSISGAASRINWKCLRYRLPYQINCQRARQIGPHGVMTVVGIWKLVQTCQ